jgi:hypothetical protein
MIEDTTDGPLRAVYHIRYFDQSWAEIESMALLWCSAHDAWEAVERWNQRHQRIARASSILVIPDPCPLCMEIEVRYV